MPDLIVFRGIYKVMEEAAEVTQEAAKACVFPVGPHPDGKGELRGRLETECADLYAALDYFCAINRLEVEPRRAMKRRCFEHWTLDGITVRHDG